MYGVQGVQNNENMYSPLLARRPAGTGYDFPEKEVKKEKKWSFGNIFRKKKKNVSESSSEEENGKMSFLQRRKKKNAARKKPTKVVGKFDHVVMPQGGRNSYTTLNGCRYNSEDPSGIFSDPTHDASRMSVLPRQENTSNQYLNVNYPGSDRSDVNVSRNSLASVDSTTKKNRKELAKARAEARRENLKYESSSDEESQRSGSSTTKFRSDESLSKYGSLSRRSRGARTERYLRRLSKEEEYRDQKVCRSDIENGRLHDSGYKTRSPLRNIMADQCNPVPYVSNYAAFDPSGMLTIPPSHNSSKRSRNFTVTTCCFDNHMSSQNSEPRKASTNQRSLSYDCNMDKHSPPPCEIVHGRLALGIPTSANITSNSRTPPLPPPRDPRRVVSITAFDNSRPTSLCSETLTDPRNGAGISRNRSPMVTNDKRKRHATDITGMHSNFRSTSEDQIAIEPVIHSLNVRPASTTPDTNHNRYAKDNGDYLLFLTDSHPRSRKPLNIQPFAKNDSVVNNLHNGTSKAHQTFSFWKQKENEMGRHKSEPPLKMLPKSPVTNNRLLPNEEKNDIPQSALLVSAISKSPVGKVRGLPRDSSPFRPISPEPKIPFDVLHTNKSPGLSVPTESLSEKSSSPNGISKKPENLEDALNELEEIYNSLKLGDEDLLDRAEKREADICKEAASNVSNRKIRKKHHSRRSADIKEDDLAFRKYNKERSKTIGDPHSITSSISYLLASPLSGDLLDEPKVKQKNNKEPDVTYDDLVYRNIKQTNNALKVLDPQPPFGIPIGPISSASNSDYLHANPESATNEKPSKRIPDVVKDDLAYRSLRKDPNKEPVLPTLSPNGDANNNKTLLIPLQKYSPNSSFRKKRAIRSLSANIFNLMQKENNEREQNELEIAKSLTEIADAMELTRQMLKDQEKTISATRKGFVSDGEALYACERSSGLEAMRRNRANFLNEMKSLEVPKAYPSSTNIDPRKNKGKVEIAKSNSKTLDELLTALAVETRETSDRITNELRMLEEGDILKSLHNSNSMSIKPEKNVVKNDNTNSKNNNGIKNVCKNVTNNQKNCEENVPKTADSQEFKNGSSETNISDDVVSEIPVVVEDVSSKNETKFAEKDEIPTELITRSLSNDSNDKADHAKMCEKLLGCVENAEVVSDDVESDHVQQIVAEGNEDLTAETSVANVVLTPTEGMVLESPNPIETEVHSEHDYENLKGRDDDEDDDDSDKDKEKTAITVSDKESQEDQKLDPDKDKSEEDRKETNDPLSENEKTKSNEINVDDSTVPKEGNKGPARSLVSLQPATTNELITSTVLHLPSNHHYAPHYERTTTSGNDEDDQKPVLAHPLEKLISPNLVKSINASPPPNSCSVQPDLCHDRTPNLRLKNLASGCDGLRETEDNSEQGNSLTNVDNLQSGASWYGNPASFALACSYGIACTYHLTTMDVLALGLLFLLASIIVSLLNK